MFFVKKIKILTIRIFLNELILHLKQQIQSFSRGRTLRLTLIMTVKFYFIKIYTRHYYFEIERYHN